MSAGRGGSDLSPLKRALLTIERLQAQVEALEYSHTQPVAVLGMGCRFPGGCSNADEYFDLLLEGGDAIRDRPPQARPGWPESARAGDFPFPPAGYLLDDVYGFDPEFFGISPREAESIDPQHRLLLEVAWEALEDAGLNPKGLEGTRTGVFVGLAGNDYAHLQLSSPRARELVHSHFASGIGDSMASGRLAYLLGLQGPAVTVDTACSSSLMAVHLACQSLRLGESDLVVAGGTNLILSGDLTRAFASSQMLAADGRCKTFDESADGFARGEGCGAVVLKRLSDAQRDGDRILGLIRATAANQDGPSSGLTAPNGPAQEDVIRTALKSGSLVPTDVDYVEAHGTGTSLGDPIEVGALGAVFFDRPRDNPLWVGSVKSNVGHLEAAAGVAAFIKAIQIVRRGEIPPQLHFHLPSSHVPWGSIALRIPTARAHLASPGRPRRVGISSFGFSGTNVHVIVEQPPEASQTETVKAPAWTSHVLPLSAPTEAALAETVDRWSAYLESPHVRWADACHTAAVGRAPFPHRVAIVARTPDEARTRLRQWRAEREAPGVSSGRVRHADRVPVAFIYTGQGSQYPGMGRELSKVSAVYRETIERCAAALEGELDVDLRDVLDPASPAASRIDDTSLTQPALYALQCGLTELWREWGVEPALVLGHSIGEYAAAYRAGVFSLEDGARLVAARGRAMANVRAPGRMAAVRADEAQVLGWIADVGPDVSIAALNAPGQVVVSGSLDAIAAIQRIAKGEGVDFTPLNTSTAFHSRLMEEAALVFGATARSVELRPGRAVRFVSTVTGGRLSPDALADPDYWISQILRPVRFMAAVESAAESVAHTLELGPHPTLSTLVAQGGTGLVAHTSLVRGRDDQTELPAALGSLYAAGVPIDWRAVGAGLTRVSAPTSVFRRRALSVDLGSAATGWTPSAHSHPLLGDEIPQPGPERVFHGTLHKERPAFIADHVVLGRALLPGTCYLEMALSAGRAATGTEVVLRDVDLVEPMTFDESSRSVRVRLSPSADGWTFTIHSASGDVRAGQPWSLHAQGALVPQAETRSDGNDPAPGSADDSNAPILSQEFYEGLAERGYGFGPLLRGVLEVRPGEGCATGTVRIPGAAAHDASRYRVHPLLLDAALQTASTALGADSNRVYLPVALERAEVWGSPGLEAAVGVLIRRQERGVVIADVDIRGGHGRVELRGATFREVDASALRSAHEDPLLEIRWAPVERGASGAVPRFEDLKQKLESCLTAGAERFDLEAYDRFVSVLERRSGYHAIRALRGLGWRPPPGEEVTLGEIAKSLSVPADRLGLLRRLLITAEEEGALEALALPDHWRATGDLDMAEAWELTPEQRASPEGLMLERCGPHLADGLLKKRDPLELLFPGGDAADAERMYHESPLARITNGAVAEVVAKLAAQCSADGPLRVLEVGGGTGGTTARIIELLDAQGGAALEYTFTDIGPLFVQRARTRWGSRRGLRFQTFDLDRHPRDQHLEPAAFDVVIAANCLHAARDLGAAVSRVRELLAPGGILLAPEVFEPHRWFDLTVGLTDGWWHFEDRSLRPTYACVTADTWERVLSHAGFSAGRAIPLARAANVAAGGLASRGQGVVVAQVSGVAASPSAAPWLVVSADDELSKELLAALAQRGVACELVALRAIGGQRDLAGLLAPPHTWAGAVYIAGADWSVGAPDGTRAEEPATRLAREIGPLVEVARALTRGEVMLERGLRIVTRGACLTASTDADLDPIAATTWGIGRTLPLEAAGIECARLDLDPVRAKGDGDRIAAWFLAPASTRETAIRNDVVLTPRLVRRGAPTESVLPAEYALEHDGSGTLDGLRFREVERVAPGAGQVEIRVAATGLNFRDVLSVLRLYPGDPGPLGAECAGVVTRVGGGVDLRPGQRVVAAVGGAYRRHVIVDARLAAPLPSHLSFAEGATIPVAYLTAWFSLNHLAHIGPGDTVLIHAATGGVGTAARVLARRAGARVIATAGTEEKRLELRNAGIEHVFDSRSDAFIDGVLRATGGAGVDVILNSLAEDLVDASFRVIARGGRFLEIGKRGIWTPERVAGLGRDIAYHVIDWGETARQEPETVGRIFAEIMALADARHLPPLRLTRYSLEDALDAFRLMARGGHTGKIVLAHPVHRRISPVTVRDDASYLIIGGTRGIGRLTTEWLADRGARHLVVMGRSSPATADAEAIERIRRSGARVEVRQGDVGDLEDVRGVVGWMRDQLPPIRGVVHCAGTLADGALSGANWASYDTVLRTKAQGTLNLADATRDDSLDFFVAYSSIASILGSPGQANHSAANCFLDAFVGASWSGSDNPMSIAWGPWRDTGSAARKDVLGRTGSLGIGALADQEGLGYLDAAFHRPGPLVVGMRLDRPEALAERADRAFFAELLRAGAPHAAPPAPARVDEEKSAGLRGELALAPSGARVAKLRDAIRKRVHSVLGLTPASEIGLDQPLGELGLDSLLAVELRNALGTAIGERLPATLLFDHPTLEALTAHLGERLGLGAAASTQNGDEDAAAPAPDTIDLMDSLEGLSDEDVDRLLSERMKST